MAGAVVEHEAEPGKAIAGHPGDIEAALAAYEQALFPRSADAAAGAATNLEICFNDNAAQSLVDQFAEYPHAQ
ncbi:hypothetical protein [Micromonospora sp. NPDC001898]|uniref:hypothetical protein n=1 Tax=Micromonospora sp. NPDC001898 TaxID=3364221 RepID=UPI003699B0FC